MYIKVKSNLADQGINITETEEIISMMIDKVLRAIRCMRKGKCFAEDGITVDFIKEDEEFAKMQICQMPRNLGELEDWNNVTLQEWRKRKL